MHKTERKFYTIRHLKIGGRVDCSGHASDTTNSGDDVCTFFFQFFLYSSIQNDVRSITFRYVDGFPEIFLSHIDLDSGYR